MKKIIVSLVVAVFLAALPGCGSAGDDTGAVMIGRDWKEGKLPQSGSERWLKANHGAGIRVAVENGTMIAEKGDLWRKHPNELRVENGTFIGSDRGEWGGSIVFKPDDGSEYEILRKNFRGFYTIGDKKFALTGLLHLMDWGGNIYELVFDDGKWKAEMALDIESCPEVFLLVSNDLYIATNKALIVVRAGKSIETLVENVFWSGLYPNSMVYANHSIFIGMRGGVYVYDLNAKTETWYDFLIEK